MRLSTDGVNFVQYTRPHVQQRQLDDAAEIYVEAVSDSATG